MSELASMHNDAERGLRAAPSALHRFCETAAKRERDNHRWQNRTGNMEDRTDSHPFEEPDGFGAYVVIDVPYAGYVAARGYVRIDQYVEDAHERFLSWLDREA